MRGILMVMVLFPDFQGTMVYILFLEGMYVISLGANEYM